MSFKAIRENEIVAKNSRFTVTAHFATPFPKYGLFEYDTTSIMDVDICLDKQNFWALNCKQAYQPFSFLSRLLSLLSQKLVSGVACIANNMDPDQTAPKKGAVLSGFILFASMIKSSAADVKSRQHNKQLWERHFIFGWENPSNTLANHIFTQFIA